MTTWARKFWTWDAVTYIWRVCPKSQVQASPFITVSASGTADFEVAAMQKDATTIISSVAPALNSQLQPSNSRP